ncbi:hypothetical protein BSL78_14949 [Apostichopus japonicus]|uniref:Sushi domain-containing protein n=1 Tax=Stichopus japonicus TaxID=307972 RepID=A0A2G8KJM4_STIJA|nr:hypothetical protein BSL78_14949 [Apostichopus japonicus]
MHDGDGCRCGNTLGSQPSTDFGQCTTHCAGGSDWICGGREFAAVYGAQVELPFIASNGFPGRLNEGVISNLVIDFVPLESPDYIYIRVHQFDLLSISVEDFFKNVSTNIKKGSDNYWISVGSNSLQIQLEDTKIGPNGLLLEFGEGDFCPQPMFISNGLFSTMSLPPFTVGNQFDVDCNSRYIPFDNTVFCTANGTVNQPIRCDAGFSTTTNLPQTPAVQSSSMAPNTPVRTFPRNPPIITAPGQCSVPVVTNGKVNGTAVRDVVSVGTVLSVSCNPIFEAVEDTSTCQQNGTFIPTPECRMNQTTFIIVLVAASVAAIFILILVAILCLLAFYFSKKRKRSPETALLGLEMTNQMYTFA